MDLRTVAQAGVDPTSGRYLTKEERIAAFRKGMQNKGKSIDPESFFNKKKTPQPDYSKKGAIVKRSDVQENNRGSIVKQQQNPEFITKLQELRKLFEKLLSIKNDRIRLENKFAETKKRVNERDKFKKEESSMESPKKLDSKFLNNKLSKAVTSATMGLFGILQSLVEYAILDWISKPENRKMVETLVKTFQSLFKFFDWFVTGMIDNLLGGFTRLFGGGSILERVFGGLKLLFGIFMLRRFLNPLLIIKDIKWIFKNIGNFKNLFKALSLKDFAKVGDSLKQIFPKFASLFKHGLKRSVSRLFLSVFGKGITKIIKPILKNITKVVVKPLAKAVTRVPVLGPLLAIPINMFLGDPIDKAAVKAVGAGLGSVALGALGSIVPGAGTAVGAVAGGLLGDWLAGWLYDSVLAPLGKSLFKKKETPQLNTGGIAKGPDEGYPVTLHGEEVVIPISQFRQIGITPYKAIGGEIIGGTLAVIRSMGPIGTFMSPIAQQTLNPYIKEFGISSETFSSNLGRIKNEDIPRVAEEPIAGRDEMLQRNLEKKEEGSRSSSGGGGGGTPDDTSADPDVGPIEGGPMHQKGANIAKKLMSMLGIKDYQAAGIIGNLIQESSLVPDRIQGSGMKRGPLKLDGRTGYSYPQWTSIDRQRNFAKYMESKGFDWKTKGATDEMATGFLVKEFKQAMSSRFTNTKNAAEASNWVLFNYERPADQGPREQKERAHDAQKVLSKMAKGGSIQGSDKEKFFTVMNIAKKSGDRIPEIAAAQFALESDYGRAVSGKFNYFGQKGTPGTKKLTTEYSGGTAYKTYAVFKDYSSPQHSISEHVKMWALNYKGYKGYNTQSNASNAAHHLKQQGYATDPVYPSKLIRIIKQHGIDPGKPSPKNIPAGGDQTSLGGGDSSGDSSGTAPGTTGAPSSTPSQPEVSQTVSAEDLRYLAAMLTGKGSAESSTIKSSSATPSVAPAAPKLPPPTPTPKITSAPKESKLPEMSAAFTLGKVSAAAQSQPVVMVTSNVIQSNTSLSSAYLNNNSITETSNLSKI